MAPQTALALVDAAPRAPEGLPNPATALFTQELLRRLVDTVDEALVVWNPRTSAVLFRNQVAARSVMNHHDDLATEVVEAARQHREFFAGANTHGMRAPAQGCRVRGEGWFVRVVRIGDELEALVCTRELMRERELLVEFTTRYHLTNRQADVLRYILRGTPSADIAQVLRISLSTVYKYESELRQAIGVRNNVQVLLLADDLRRRR